jgi:hypothetical protein
MKSFYSLSFLFLFSVCVSAQINIVSQPTVSNISNTGFTVTWTTDVQGTTSLKYGHTTAFELGVITGASNVTTHTVNVSGTASQVFYVQGYSSDGSNTTYSDTKIFMTASNSSGVIKCYFTRSVDTSVANPAGNYAKQLLNAIDDTAAAYINRAQATLDIAIYNLDNSSSATTIINAINSAYNRGVRVRLIYEAGNSNTGLPLLNSAIPTLGSPQSSSYGIMHNKFMIADANASDANLPVVWTGSTNWTNEQLLQDCNNVIILQDQSLAIGYTMEFEEMWGGSSANPNLALSVFGPFKTDNTPHEYIVGGKRVENYFSPSDGTNSHLIQTIQNAQNNIFFNVLVMTRTDVATAIANAASAGAYTAGMVNDTGSQYSGTCFQTIASVVGNRMMLYNGTYLLHHKYLMEDVNTSNDPLIWTGSHNWSNSAEQRNDENVVVVHDQSITNQYYQEFIQRFHDNGGVISVTENNPLMSSFIIFPNPSDGIFHVSYEMKKSADAELCIADICGKILSIQKAHAQQGMNYESLDLSRLSKGIYLLHINSGQQASTFRIAVQ